MFNSTRLLLAVMCAFLLTSLVMAQTGAPAIGYVSKYGASLFPERSVIIYGENFTAATKILAWCPSSPANTVPASWQKLGTKLAVLPATPPESSKELPILKQTSQVIIALADGLSVLWAQQESGTSQPVVFGRPEIWMVSDQDLLPGQRLRVFGINFNPAAQHVYLRNEKTGVCYQAKTFVFWSQSWVNVDECEMDCLVPTACPPGEYTVYAHAGVGMDYGFSDPYRVHISTQRSLAGALRRPNDAAPSRATTLVTAKGLVSGGIADNTAKLQATINALAMRGGGILQIPEGIFAISTTLHLLPGVILQGSGQEATRLVVSSFHPLHGGFPPITMTPSLDWQTSYAGDWQKYMKDYTPMIWVETNAGIKDITLIGGPGTAAAVFVAQRDWHNLSKDVFLVRVNIENSQRIANFADFAPEPSGIYVGSATEGFTLWHCNIRACAPLEMLPARPEHRWAQIIGNRFVGYPKQSADCVFLDSLAYSVIEENEAVGGARTWTSQRGFHNNWFFNNVTRDVGRRGNADEMMMSEYGSNFWVGQCAGATASTITVADTPKWKPNQFTQCSDTVFVFILAGRGLGQFRKVISNTADTLTLDQPWAITPDTESRFAVTGLTYRNLYINNSVYDSDGRVELAWGSLVECVVMGHLSYHNEGLSTTSWIMKDKEGKVTDHTIAAHNLYAKNRIMQDGWITLLEYAVTDYPSPGSTFGNIVRDNEIFNFRNYTMNQYSAIWASDKLTPEKSAAIGISGSFNVIEGNYLCNGPVGINIRNRAMDNVIRNNRYGQVNTEVLDEGKGTVIIPAKEISR